MKERTLKHHCEISMEKKEEDEVERFREPVHRGVQRAKGSNDLLTSMLTVRFCVC